MNMLRGLNDTIYVKKLRIGQGTSQALHTSELLFYHGYNFTCIHNYYFIHIYLYY